MKPITRRSMLALLGAGVVGGIAAAAGRLFAESDEANTSRAAPPDASTSTSGPVVTLDTSTPIGRIGAAYVALTPDEASRDRLLELVPELDGVPRGEIESQLGVLAARVREDFAAGDTVSIDGWMLAVSEARGAALVALS